MEMLLVLLMLMMGLVLLFDFICIGVFALVSTFAIYKLLRHATRSYAVQPYYATHLEENLGRN